MRERVQRAIQNTDKQTQKYERETDTQTERMSSRLDTKTQGLKSLLEMHNRYRDLKRRNTSNKVQNRQMQLLLQLAVATTRQMHMGNSHTKSIA
jgi:frataxin-like iron-binding protein CyaY